MLSIFFACHCILIEYAAHLLLVMLNGGILAALASVMPQSHSIFFTLIGSTIDDK